MTTEMARTEKLVEINDHPQHRDRSISSASGSSSEMEFGEMNLSDLGHEFCQGDN